VRAEDHDARAPEESIEALAQVLGMWRYEATAMEGAAWRQIMAAAPVARFRAFLQQHVMAGSGFPPKPSEAAKALQLVVDPESAYAMLERLVRETGPYKEPQLDDPVMVQAILYMGGWVTLNEQMPDPQNGFAVKSFRERWDACFTQAVSAVRINGQLPTQPLLSLSSPRGMPAPALGHAASPQIASERGADARVVSITRSQRYGVPPQ
jgi:hypothetical protein